MTRVAACPRCSTPLAQTGDSVWSCPEHGPTAPLWRAAEASYDEFVGQLDRAGGFPIYLPWPMPPGWQVTDFAVVGGPRARASLTCVTGSSDIDGPVDVLIVAEEPGTGLGARCAGTSDLDPVLDGGPAALRVRLDAVQVPLWPVSVSDAAGEWDRSVLAGEGQGRWLWLVLRPASALLMLRREWALRDVSRLGPALVELPFGGPAPAW